MSMTTFSCPECGRICPVSEMDSEGRCALCSGDQTCALCRDRLTLKSAIVLDHEDQQLYLCRSCARRVKGAL